MTREGLLALLSWVWLCNWNHWPEEVTQCHSSSRPWPLFILTWTGAPEGTKSLSLIADEPDAPVGTWTPWIIWNIPPEAAALSEGVPKNDTPQVWDSPGV